MTQRRDDWADACCHTLHGQPVQLRRSEMYEGALEAGWSEEDAEAAAINVIMFFFYHEVGRGLARYPVA